MTLKYSEYIIPPAPDRIHKICHSYPQQEQGGQGMWRILQKSFEILGNGKTQEIQ